MNDLLVLAATVEKLAAVVGLTPEVIEVVKYVNERREALAAEAAAVTFPGYL